jgi:hypothetical protein
MGDEVRAIREESLPIREDYGSGERMDWHGEAEAESVKASPHPGH